MIKTGHTTRSRTLSTVGLACLWVLGLLMTVAIQPGCVPLQQTPGSGTGIGGPKRLQNIDRTYEPGFASVQLFPNRGAPADPFTPPMVPLGQTPILTLAFDELTNRYQNYYLRIEACNWDWRPAILQEMEYLETFNEYPLTEYELSQGTRVPYIHYRIQMPQVKLSGNYVAVIYRNANRDDIILSRRFVVFEQVAPVTQIDIRFAAGARERFTHQQVDFEVSYQAYPIINPMQTVHTVIRQNGRWDNAIFGLPPFFIQENDRILSFAHNNLENAFPAGNEWRTFDTRNMRVRSFGVDQMTYTNEEATAILTIDQTRNLPEYSFLVDQNGYWAADRRDVSGDPAVISDYVDVTFRLRPPRGLPQGDFYVFGELTDWQALDPFRLRYDEAQGIWTTTVRLKQGIYNYKYAIVDAQGRIDTYPLEGSYAQTENLYDVLLYHRPIGARYDQVAAYRRGAFLPRR